MVQQLKFLNSKESKHIYELLEQQFGFTGKLELIFMLAEKKERVYVFNKDLGRVVLSKLLIDSMGLYFASFFDNKIRLTIEGTQILGSQCTKNIIDVNKKEMQTWLMGEKLIISALQTPPAVEPGAFVIIRYGKDYLGCGKVAGDLILNYIPKTRYIHALYDDVPNAPGEDLPPAIEK